MTLTLLFAGLALFFTPPFLAGMGPLGTELWYSFGTIFVTLVSGLVALHTAADCGGSTRQAWRVLALACFSWTAGTLTWTSYSFLGGAVPFPSIADAFYLACNIFFLAGIFLYSLAGAPGRHIQATNFAFALCSTMAVGFILYGPLLIDPDIGRLGGAIIFAYPTLGLGALVFGLLCLLLYTPKVRRFPFLLILVAAGVHASADFFFAVDILGGSHSAGAVYDVLWLAAFAFVGWAALEHRTESELDVEVPARRVQAPRLAEALIPVLAIAAILVAGAAARWGELRPEHIFVLPTMFLFAALLTVREFVLIGAERKLRHELEHRTKQLSKSQTDLSAVLASTTDGVLSLDTDWRVIYANQNAIDFFFLGREFLGDSIWKLLPDLVGSKIDTHFRKAMENQASEKIDLNYTRLGRWFDIHADPAPDKLTVFLRDVTAQRRVEERFRHVAQASSDYIFDRDFASETTWVSDAASWLQDHEAGATEVPRGAWVESVHPEDSKRILSQIEAAIEGGQNSWEGEYRLRQRDGSYIPVLERANILRDENGKPVRMIGNIVNLSERKALEAQLRQAQRLDAVGQLTGGIAHDFNNLLTVILGNAEALTDTLPADQPSATMARQIMIASERAAGLTQHLLAFARKQPLLPGVFDANELIEGMRLLVSRSITPAITLELKLAENLGAIYVDRALFESALLNLCVNARDAMRDGGLLRIETGPVSLAGSTAPDAPPAGEYVRVIVSDTGSGMDEETLAQAVEPFFTTKPVGEGSGLGLSMVHGFVHQSGGHLQIQSSLGIGTTVELLLPKHVLRVDHHIVSEAHSIAKKELPRRRVLVVDDEDQVREHICRVVKSLGHDVVVESRAIPALNRLHNGEPFDLLLSDVVMPDGLSGRQLAATVLDEWPELPVLLVSGHAEDFATSDGKLDSRIGFLFKPFRKKDLEQKLSEMLFGPDY